MNTKFKLRDKVTIIELERPGHITGVMHEDAGVSYRVAYFNNGTRHSEWLYESEIKLRI